MDEPTGALNSEATEQVLEILKKLNEQGVTIVMVTHDPKVASQTKKIVYIKDGMIANYQKRFSTNNVILFTTLYKIVDEFNERACEAISKDKKLLLLKFSTRYILLDITVIIIIKLKIKSTKIFFKLFIIVFVFRYFFNIFRYAIAKKICQLLIKYKIINKQII